MATFRGRVVYHSRGRHGPLEVVDLHNTRSLYFGNDTCQSAMSLHDPALLALSYTRFMMCSLLFRDQPHSVLLLGLGGGSLVRFILQHYPDCRIDAVEPREDVIDVAKDLFKLPKDPHLHVHATEGSVFAQSAPWEYSGYDMVLVDAFDATGVVQPVTESEFFSAVRERMGRDGVLSINLSRLQKSLYRGTLKALRRNFPKTVLRLPVLEKANEIALAFRSGIHTGTLKNLERRAQILEERLGLEFSKFLHILRRQNSSLLD